MIAFSNVQSGIGEIPFPSVTVCNMNKVPRSKMERLEQEARKKPDDPDLAREADFVREVCLKAEEEEVDKFMPTRNNYSDVKQGSLSVMSVNRYFRDLGSSCATLAVASAAARSCSAPWSPTTGGAAPST